MLAAECAAERSGDSGAVSSDPIRRESLALIAAYTTRQACPVGAQSGLSRGTKSGHQVKALSPGGKSVETVFERVAAGCAIPCSALELMRKEGRTDRTKFKKSVLDILLSDGILEYTIPDKPRSRLQKYRLTEKGRAVLRKPQG